jgi:hypothetical protein
MKAFARRLEQLEARSIRTDAAQNDLARYDLQVAMMVIVAWNTGEWTEQDFPATAVARELGMTPSELKNAFNGGNSDIWRLTLKKLSIILVERGERPIIENGDPMIELPTAVDVLRKSRDALERLYAEVPQGLKSRHQMLMFLTDSLL